MKAENSKSPEYCDDFSACYRTCSRKRCLQLIRMMSVVGIKCRLAIDAFAKLKTTFYAVKCVQTVRCLFGRYTDQARGGICGNGVIYIVCPGNGELYMSGGFSAFEYVEFRETVSRNGVNGGEIRMTADGKGANCLFCATCRLHGIRIVGIDERGAGA